MRKSLLLAICLSACSGACGAPGADPSLRVPAARLESVDSRERGRALFLTHCAQCHGTAADGQGARRLGLSPRPVDFTDPRWAARTPPASVFRAIRHGVRNTAMPAWPALDDASTWDLVAYVRFVSRP